MPGCPQPLTASTAESNAAGPSASTGVLPADEWPALSTAGIHRSSTLLPAQVATAVQTAQLAPLTTAAATAPADSSHEQAVTPAESSNVSTHSQTTSPAGGEVFDFGSFPNLQGLDGYQLHAPLQAPPLPVILPAESAEDMMLPSGSDNNMMHCTFGNFPNLQGVEETDFASQPMFWRAATGRFQTVA